MNSHISTQVAEYALENAWDPLNEPEINIYMPDFIPDTFEEVELAFHCFYNKQFNAHSLKIFTDPIDSFYVMMQKSIILRTKRALSMISPFNNRTFFDRHYEVYAIWRRIMEHRVVIAEVKISEMLNNDMFDTYMLDHLENERELLFQFICTFYPYE
jgi:hypothetical protein